MWIYAKVCMHACPINYVWEYTVPAYAVKHIQCVSFILQDFERLLRAFARRI